MYFAEREGVYFILKFFETCPQWFDWQQFSIGPINGSPLNRRQPLPELNLTQIYAAVGRHRIKIESSKNLLKHQCASVGDT